jgi:hypothetical protein
VVVGCASITDKGLMGKGSSCSNQALGRKVASYDREEDTSDKVGKKAGTSSSYDSHSPAESLAP